MSWWNHSPEEIIGKTLEAWRETDDGESIYLEFADGTEAKFFHRQDCCEWVSLQGNSYRDLDKFIGQVITGLSQDESRPEIDDRYSSVTLTDITFRFGDDSVVASWRGESNGYYSESIDFWCSWSNEV